MMSAKICKIELSKENGITVQVQNGAVTQTITLDGDKITMEVQGTLGVSTIVQDGNSVKVTCNEFVVDSQTIKCTGSMSADIESGPSKLSLSPATADLEGAETMVRGNAMCNIMGSDINLAGGEAVTVSTAGEIALTGSNINLTAAIGTEHTGPQHTFIGVPIFA
jgi:hypothetical protein